jgi:2-keto-3-deoxy-L-arabinonate dehydratase
MNVPELELIRFFGAVADGAEIPVGIQNAPEHMGIGLSNSGLATLNRSHPNVTIAKLEAPPINIRRLLDDTGGAIDVFDGRGGLAMIEALRAGAVGIIPGGESFDVLVRIFRQVTGGDAAAVAGAERLYIDALPLHVFLMQSLDALVVYGKQVLCQRLGIAQSEARIPCTPPTEFGIETARRYASDLGPL